MANPIVQAAQITVTANPVDNVLNLLTAFGFFRVVLPFLLVYAIIYGVLLKTKVLGDPENDKWTKSTSAIVALAIAFFIIGYSPVVKALATLIPQVAFVLVTALLLLMLMSMFGINLTDNFKDATKKWTAWIIIIPLAVIMLGIVGYVTDIPILTGVSGFLAGAGGPLDPELVNLLIGLAVVVVIPIAVVGIVTWSSSSGGSAPPRQPGGG